MSDVRRAAAALLHRVADGSEIQIEVLRGFADLALRSELSGLRTRAARDELRRRLPDG